MRQVEFTPLWLVITFITLAVHVLNAFMLGGSVPMYCGAAALHLGLGIGIVIGRFHIARSAVPRHGV